MYFCDLSHSEGIRKCMLSILKFWYLSYHRPVSAFYPPLLVTFANNQGQEVFNRDGTWLGKKILLGFAGSQTAQNAAEVVIKNFGPPVTGDLIRVHTQSHR